MGLLPCRCSVTPKGQALVSALSGACLERLHGHAESRCPPGFPGTEPGSLRTVRRRGRGEWPEAGADAEHACEEHGNIELRSHDSWCVTLVPGPGGNAARSHQRDGLVQQMGPLGLGERLLRLRKARGASWPPWREEWGRVFGGCGARCCPAPCEGTGSKRGRWNGNTTKVPDVNRVSFLPGSLQAAQGWSEAGPGLPLVKREGKEFAFHSEPCDLFARRAHGLLNTGQLLGLTQR